MASGWSEVEIHGSDLGKSFPDIANTVSVAGYPCFANPKKYLPSRRIFCNTSASTSGPVSGPIKVTVNNFLGQSAQQFYYQNPDPRDFNPKKGPRSGGTNVNITGNNMNTGIKIHHCSSRWATMFGGQEQGNKYECSMYRQSSFKQKKKKIFK